MEYQQQWQGVSAGARDRVDFVRNVYLWLMGGFAVAALGAFSAPFVAAALIPRVGQFVVWILFGAQFGVLFFALSLFVNLYVIFISLLNLLSGRRR